MRGARGPRGVAPALRSTPEMETFRSITTYNHASAAGKLVDTFLRACYQLDGLICGTNQVYKDEIRGWQSMDVLTYLSSPILLNRWEDDLTTLCQHYLDGTFNPDTFEHHLEVLLPGVETLEQARSRLVDELEDEIEKSGFDIEVPGQFWEAIEERCAVIDHAFIVFGKALDSLKVGYDGW